MCLNIKSIIIILLLQAFLLSSKGQSFLINTEKSFIGNKNTFTNPLLNSGPDPWVIQKNGFFKSPDGKEDWIIYHANAKPDLKCSDERSPRMQKFTWNADGTPNFGEPVKINTKILNPSGE